MKVKCNQCGKEIDSIEYQPFRYCNISQCMCEDGGYILVVPKGRVELKCPECGGYPFKFKPKDVEEFIQYRIPERSPEEIIEDII